MENIHLFLNRVKCDEARNSCFKIPRKSSEGDSKKLIAELQTLETLQNVDNQGEKPNQFINAQPDPNATSKVIWKKIVGGSVKFAKDGVTKQNIAGRDLKLAKW